MAPRRRANASVSEPKFDRNTRIEDLLGTELFRDASELIIAGIRKSSRICSLKANRRLYTTRKNRRTRERVDFIYVILDGHVAIWVPSCFDSNQEVFLAWRGPQQILGELKEIGAKPSTTRITTCDECKFIEIKLASFLEFAAKDSSLYRNVAHLLSRKILNEGHRSEVVQMASVTRKVAQTLIHLAQERCKDFSDSQIELEIPGVMRQGEIAAYAGIPRRETVNKELNDFRDQGFINYSGKRGSRITISNLPELRRIVESKGRNRSQTATENSNGND